jgi:hypothetical protein
MLAIHGLTVDIIADPERPRAAGADVCWLRVRGPAPDAPPGVGWAWRAFAGRGGAAVAFAVSPDGGEVVSWASDVVSERDELGLFAEAVMRTVMRRLGVVSLHAAALARHGAAVLVMGDKGAGKSSFAAALCQSGWSLMADDLARVLERDGVWRVAAGHRQTRLNADVAAALGYDPARLEQRWTPGQPREETPNKHVVSHAGESADEDLPIAAIYALGARDPALAAAAVTSISAAERLGVLLGNLSDDPLDARSPPSAQAKAAIVSLLRSVPVRRLSLPDDLVRLRAVAETFQART